MTLGPRPAAASQAAPGNTFNLPPFRKNEAGSLTNVTASADGPQFARLIVNDHQSVMPEGAPEFSKVRREARPASANVSKERVTAPIPHYWFDT